MSCEIKCISKLVDLERIRKLFGLSTEDNWLQAVNLSLSPTRELLVFGFGTLLIGLTPQWDEELREHVLKIAWLESLANENDLITSLLCLPVISASHSTQTTPEWTCVAVGLSSGYVNFYNDDGHLLRAQRFYNNEPVSCIQAQSGRNMDELITIQSSANRSVAIVQGTQLFPLLRAPKHNHHNQPSPSDSEPMKIPCQKWMYDGNCGDVLVSLVIGAQKGCAFDHLLSTCMEEGIGAQYKATRSQTSLVLTAGSRPFLGFQYAREGFNATELADAAKAVARMIKSALPSWLSSKREQPEQPKSPPPPIMSCKFGVCDAQRNAYFVWVSPNKSLAAVTDNLGRIVVVDCHRAVVVRMFKGYRDAQCGFVEVKNDVAAAERQKRNGKTGKLRATFLVIYAPRRGLIEVWPLQKGQRVGAFSAPANGQLLYNVHSLMGVTTTAGKVKWKGSPCVFFDPQQGTFQEIVVPFHLALSGSNSQVAKDMHLLKRLKQIVRGTDYEEGCGEAFERVVAGIKELVPQIESTDFRRECLELVTTVKRTCPGLVKATVEAIVGGRGEGEDDDDQKVEILRENYRRLVTFYECVVAQGRDGGDEEAKEEEEPPNKIQLNDMELLNIQKLIDLSTLEQTEEERATGKVTFDERGVRENQFLAFLAVFSVDKADVVALKEKEQQGNASVGELIFRPFLQLNRPLGQFARVCKDARLDSASLVQLFLSFWLARPFDYTRFEALILDLTRFTAILAEICVVAGRQTEAEYNSICPWWQSVREFLLENPNSMRSLLAALMCRNLCLRGEGKEAVSVTDTDTEFEDGFENMSQEACQWNLLIGKLDDISVLGAILNNTMRAEAEVYPKLRPKIPRISLRMILGGGRGVISELVAKWLTGTGMDPHLILEAIESPQDEGGPSTSNLRDYQLTDGDLVSDKQQQLMKERRRDVKVEPVLNSLQIMRGNFPFSLQSSKVLANMGWEYMGHWSKHLAELQYLEAGILCLRLIREKAIRQAMCAMVWRAHLKIPLEAAKKLIFKAGRLPRERLCLQDVGLSDAIMPEFLQRCEAFLEVYVASCSLEMVVVRYEDTLKEGPPQPLIEVALKNRPAVLEVLNVHLELVQVLHLVAHFNFKWSKQLAGLFDQTGNQLMFGDLGGEPKDAIVVTEHIRRYRLEFLNRVVTAAMELIRWNGEEEEKEKAYLGEYEQWMRRIHKLADTWRVDRVQMSVHTVRGGGGRS